MTAERSRLDEAREDYSANGDAWNSFPSLDSTTLCPDQRTRAR